MSDWASDDNAKEEAYSVRYKVTYDGQNEGSVVLRCPWADRNTIAAEILNGARIFPDANMGALAAQIEITPVPNSAYTVVSGLIVYEHALLKVNYNVSDVGSATKKTDPVSGTQVLVEETIEPTVEYLSVDHKIFRWGSNTGPKLRENEAQTRPMYGLGLTRTVHGITSIDASILTMPGRTNDTAYDSDLGITFEEETLLFVPQPIRRTSKTDGSVSFSVTLKWAYKEKGWNKVWRAAKAGDDKYDIVWDTANNAQYKNFPPIDMSKFLF